MSALISNTTVYRQTPDSAESVMAQETVLLHLANGTYYGLDETGTFVWSLLKDGASLAAILDAAHARYGVAQNVLEADISSFLADLIKHDLLMPDSDETE